MSQNYTYPTIKIVETKTRGLGNSDTAALGAMFPTSPGLSLNSSTYKTEAMSLLLNGTITENLQVGPSFSRDYVDSPNYGDVKTGPGGLPASPWVPNPASPGEGSANPGDMPAPPTGFGTIPTNSLNPIPVDNSTRDPSVSSKKMSESPDKLTLGRSQASINET